MPMKDPLIERRNKSPVHPLLNSPLKYEENAMCLESNNPGLKCKSYAGVLSRTSLELEAAIAINHKMTSAVMQK